MRRIIDLRNLLNRKHPLNRGLVAEWAVLPGLAGGKYFYDIVGRNHGTLTNGPVWTPNSRPGGFASLGFDGSDDYVQMDGPRWALGNNFTFSFWFNSRSVSDRGFVYFQTSVGTQFNFLLNPDVSGALGVHIEGSFIAYTNASVYEANRWYHATYIKRGDGATHEIYLNGQPLSLAANTAVTFTDEYTSRAFGLRLGVGQGMNGHLDNIQFYDRALSASEVQQLYRESIAGNPNRWNWLEIEKLSQSQLVELYSRYSMFKSPVIRGVTNE